MSFDYAEAAATAVELLTEFGAPVTLRNLTIPTYDPSTGTAPGAAAADVSRIAAMFDFGTGQTTGPAGLIQGGDKRCLMQVGIVPGLEDHVIANGVEYAIKGIGEINPAGTPVLYDLHLRT